MKVIVPQSTLFEKAIGEQSVKDQEYRILKFAFIYEENDIIFFYNNLTKELLTIMPKEFNDLKQIDKDSTFITNLIKKWFLVPVDFNECRLSDQVKQLARELNDRSLINTFDIFTTTDCNARCFYCFEADAVKKYMNESVAADVAQYIIRKSKGKKVHIQWFGGEPLCNKRAIDIISKTLTESNVDFSSIMTTNGYLFNHKTVLNAVENWHLKRVQITLDGLADTYCRIKNYKNNDFNAFDRVIENIGCLLENKVLVKVRLNMDNANSEELFELVDFLDGSFGNNKYFSIYARCIFENMGFVKKSRTENEKHILRERFNDLTVKIANKHLNGKGILDNKISIYSCMADNPNIVMILPDGKLGYCEHYLDDMLYGSIYTDDAKEPWSEYIEPDNKCFDCIVYPTCMRLKNCNTVEKICDDVMQKNEIGRIKNSIYYTYEKMLEK